MKPSLIKHLRDHSATGTWTGAVQENIPVIRISGELVSAEPFLARLGIKLTKTNKYTERLENAGMGESQSGGDTSDVGDGVSKEQE